MKFLPGFAESSNSNLTQDFTPPKLLTISALAVLVMAAALYLMLRPKPELNISSPQAVPQGRQADDGLSPQINNDVSQHARSTGTLLQHALDEVDQALVAIHRNHLDPQTAHILEIDLYSARIDLTRAKTQVSTIRALVTTQAK